MELIYNEFIKKQKEGLESFISNFSEQINNYYQYMNPSEQFHELRIVSMGEEDGLTGITIEFKFNNEWISPPQKYFSESHLNCFGIAFFLASVNAFNNENKFFILDDVISSFDTNHRKRFADLLFEHFSNWQILLFTHEDGWYEYLRPLAKNKGWKIVDVKWAQDEGTFIDSTPSELKELIKHYIDKNEIRFIGNPLRQYLERILKDICIHFEIKLCFKNNEQNNKRMPDEMLSALLSAISKKSTDLKSKIPILEKVLNSNILGNLYSHDNPFVPKIGDIKAFWADVIEFEKLFYCQHSECKKNIVEMKHYDTVKSKIRCGCGKTNYDWKR